MAERRMLLNSTESFVGTMRIDFTGRCEINLNNNMKLLDCDENSDGGYYVIGFKKELLVHSNFIQYDSYTTLIQFESGYNITFDYNSVNSEELIFRGNFTFKYNSIIAYYIKLRDYNYLFDDDCFDCSILEFQGRRIKQLYYNANNHKIYAHPHILYDLMKCNNIEEGDERAQNYRILYNYSLYISSPIRYMCTTPNVDLGNNNYIIDNFGYQYDGNYITEYICSYEITHLRKGIILPQNATVYFPDTVTDIDNDFDTDNVTFMNESNLKKVVIFGNCKLTYLGGFYNSSLENIEIYNNKIIDIKHDCFYGVKLKNIIIPSSVTRIDNRNFNNCDKLEDITIPDNVEYIGEYTFVQCDNLKNVYIGKKLMNVFTNSFGSPIENITIDNNNLEIDKSFYRINSLKNINVNYDNPNYSSIDGILFNKNNDSILLYPHNRETTYIIQEGIVNIGTYAFRDNPYITCITIPGSINIVKGYTFHTCSKLNTFIIKDGVIGIEDYFFIYCSNTVEIRIPKTIENFGVIGLNDKIISIYYEGSTEEYCNINFDQSGLSGNAKYNINLYIQDKLITELTIPNNITLVSPYKCIGHNSITTINIPKSVTSFGYKAFYVSISTDTIINYEGTEEEWNKINKSQAFGNRNLTINYLGEGIPPNNEI